MSPDGLIAGAIRAAQAASPDGPPVIGLCGAQGSGKSTLADQLAARIPHLVTLSLDDLYLPRSRREWLAQSVHPLLRTRGVPGTHDVDLGLAVLADLRAGRPVRLPRFDKGADDRLPESCWLRVAPPYRCILFEGWCVGARPQPVAALAEPVNALERDEDGDGRWRVHVNTMLGEAYPPLFATLDRLVLLAAPDWPTVYGWRRQQEAALRARGGAHVMDDAALARFVAHYERLTRWILADMPARALTLHLNPARDVRRVTQPLA